MLVNAVFRVCAFPFRARHDDVAWLPPAKRSNAGIDGNGRAMDIAFISFMGMLLPIHAIHLPYPNVKKNRLEVALAMAKSQYQEMF